MINLSLFSRYQMVYAFVPRLEIYEMYPEGESKRRFSLYFVPCIVPLYNTVVGKKFTENSFPFNDSFVLKERLITRLDGWFGEENR